MRRPLCPAGGRASPRTCCLCINTGKFRTDTNRMRMEGDQFYIRSPQEMYATFTGLEDAVARSQEIANAVDIQLDLGKRHFPTFQLPPQRTSAEYLRELCEAGLRERYATDPHRWQNGDPHSGELSEEVRQRLDRELDVINKLGFADYFLIVWDFVRYAVEHDIPCTARGSGVGSLVCYRAEESATSARWSTTCCSSDSSTRIAARRPISTSTSARIAAAR